MKKRMGGYLTLEFTLLLPVLIMVILLLTEAGLYFYNRCLLKENAQILALQMKQEAGGLLTEEDLLNHVSGLERNKYLMLGEIETQYCRDGNKITVTIIGKMYNFCSIVGIGDHFLTLREEADCQYMDKTGILGTIRAVKRKIEAISEGEDS